MKNNNFRSFYKKLIESQLLSPSKAKEILRNILKNLTDRKEDRHEML